LNKNIYYMAQSRAELALFYLLNESDMVIHDIVIKGKPNHKLLVINKKTRRTLTFAFQDFDLWLRTTPGHPLYKFHLSYVPGALEIVQSKLHKVMADKIIVPLRQHVSNDPAAAIFRYLA